MFYSIRSLPFDLFNPWIIHLHILASLISLSFSNDLSILNKKLCQEVCQCTASTIDCNHQDKIQFIPTEIKRDYNQLHINHAEFLNRGLSRDNFTQITHLTSLKLVYSKLETIEEGTFSEMDRLQYLDLSHNRFSTISSRAFDGLKLAQFYLERNDGGLTISADMFSGLKVKKLFLKGNSIANLPVTPFQSMNIVMLSLFNNSITTLDQGFQQIFDNYESLLDSTKNPLHCGCGFNWYSDLINKWKDVTSSVDIVCHTPTYLRGRKVKELKKTDFPCQIPSINKILLDMSHEFLQLICYAKGDTKPRVSWKQINSKSGNEIAHYEDVQMSDKFSSVILNVTKVEAENSFICTASNEINVSNEVHVKVKLLENIFDRQQKAKQTPSEIGSGSKLPNDSPPQIQSESHFLFRKQFSIVQMIGAVVGTFTSVVVLIVIVYCTQEHYMKKNSNANPYWTIVPTEAKSSSNRMVKNLPPTIGMATSLSSQEYDIPQYNETNNFLQSYYTERNVPQFPNVKPNTYFSTVT